MDDLTALAGRLATRHLARVVVRHDVVDSTNARAMALSKRDARHGLAVVADAQTDGRGQRGRRWASAPSVGLYASFVLRTQLPPAQAATVTLATGVAVVRALQPLTPLALGLKWPNDVLVAERGPQYGRKLAGILFEVIADADAVRHAVVGIGVNRQAPSDPALQGFATSLFDLGAETIDPLDLLARIANALEPELDRLEAGGLADVCRAWTDAALGIGETVELDAGDRRARGVLLGLDRDGALLLRTLDGDQPQHHGRLTLPGVPKPEGLEG